MAILFILLFLSSCPIEKIDYLEVPPPSSSTLPVLTTYELVDNLRVQLYFDREVYIREVIFEKERLSFSRMPASYFSIILPEKLEEGEKASFRVSVSSRTGTSSSRFSLPLTGTNPYQADFLITEVSVKGTDTSPDRIELYALCPGTTGAITVTDAKLGLEDLCYTLPSFRVEKGDIIVIYIDKSHNGQDKEYNGMGMTYYLEAEEEEGLLSTNGSVLLYSHTNGKGKLLDAMIYRKSDTQSASGFGNNKTEKTMEYLEAAGAWSGEVLESDKTTSTRTFCRYYPYSDTNTEEDWYLSDTRTSSFGYVNSNQEYQEDQNS